MMIKLSETTTDTGAFVRWFMYEERHKIVYGDHSQSFELDESIAAAAEYASCIHHMLTAEGVIEAAEEEGQA